MRKNMATKRRKKQMAQNPKKIKLEKATLKPIREQGDDEERRDEKGYPEEETMQITDSDDQETAVEEEETTRHTTEEFEEEESPDEGGNDLEYTGKIESLEQSELTRVAYKFYKDDAWDKQIREEAATNYKAVEFDKFTGNRLNRGITRLEGMGTNTYPLPASPPPRIVFGSLWVVSETIYLHRQKLTAEYGKCMDRGIQEIWMQ
ncbi:hypothetical protein KI387_009875, partial [Taxus chinensis]